jgi:hypothetical protein
VNNTDKTVFPVLVFAGLSVLFVSLGIYYIYYGRLFLDAGFYLNAARETSEGHMPYRDFFYVQGPVYPYVYGTILKFAGFTVLHARAVSLCFGLAAIVLAGFTAFRSGGRGGAVITLAMLATVPSHAYYFSSVKLYSLSAFFLTAAFAVLGSRIPLTLRHTSGLVLVVLAAATRLTLVPAVIVTAIYIIHENYVLRHRFPRTAIGTAAAAGLALALPFLLADAGAVIYFLIGIHTSAADGPYRYPFSKQLRVLMKIALYYPVLILGLSYVVCKVCNREYWRSLKRLDLAMAFSVLAVTAAHLTANWFSPGYQSVVMPLTAGLIGGLSGRWLAANRLTRAGYVAGAALMVFSGLWTWQAHVWTHDSATVPGHLNRIALEIDRRSDSGSPVAACSAVFALQANRPVMSGFGGAPFTYTPNWTDAQCRRFGGLNNHLLIDLLNRKEAGALLFEANSFSVGFPGFYSVPETLQEDVFNAIDANYVKNLTLPSLGDGSPNLVLYIPREDTE